MAITYAKLMAVVDADVTPATSKLRDFGLRMTRAGFLLGAAVGIPIAAMGDEVIDVTAKFDSSMGIMQKASKATGSEMERVSDLAIKMGNDLSLPGTSAADAGESMANLAKAGLTLEQSMGAVRGAVQLATAGNIGHAESAKIVAGAIHAFNMEATDATSVANLLAAAATESTAEVHDMGKAFQMAASVWGLAGMEASDLATALTLMANAGIHGSDSGTSLKMMLMRLMAPTQKSSNLMDDLGIAVYDASGNMVSAREIIAEFNDGLAGLSEEQRNAALTTIFGSDAIRAASVILANNVSEWDRQKTAISDSTAAAEMAAARMNGVAGAVERVKNAWETFLLRVGIATRPIIEGVSTILATLLTKLSELPPWFIQLAAVVAIAVAALGPLVAVIGAVMYAASTLGPVIAMASKVFLGLGLGLNPVTLGLGLLAAAALLVATNWDRVGYAFERSTNSLSAVRTLVDGVTESASKLGISFDFDMLNRGLAGFAAGWRVVDAVISLAIRSNIIQFNMFKDLIVDGFKIIKAAATLNFDEVGRLGSELADKQKRHMSDLANVAQVEWGRIAEAPEIYSNALDVLNTKFVGEGPGMWQDELFKASGSWGEFANTAESAAGRVKAKIDALTRAHEGFARAQLLVNTGVGHAASALDHWGSEIDQFQRGLDFLNEQQEKNGALTEEQARQFDTLSWAVDRHKNGIENDLMPAYLRTLEVKAELQQKMDTLNQAYQEGKVDEQAYAKAAEDIAKALDPMAGITADWTASMDNLIGKMDIVIQRFDAWLQSLGIVPPEVKTEVSLPNVDAEQIRLLEYNDVIVKTPTEWITKLYAETQAALSNLATLRETIYGIPSSFTINAGVNIASAREALGHLGDMIPHSPAKEGPLAFEPDWSSYVDGFPEAVEEFGTAGVDMMAESVEGFTEQAEESTKALSEWARASADAYTNLEKLADPSHLAGLEKTARLSQEAFNLAVEQGADQEVLEELARRSTEARDAYVAAGELAGTTYVQAFAAQLASDEASEKAAQAFNSFLDSMRQLSIDTFSSIDKLADTDYLKGLEDDMRRSQAAFDAAVRAGRPQEELDELAERSTLAREKWRMAGELDGDAYVQALRKKIADEAATQSQFDALDLLPSLKDGSFAEQHAAEGRAISEKIAVAKASGASEEVMAMLRAEFEEWRRIGLEAGAIFDAAVAEGIISNAGPITEAGLSELVKIRDQFQAAGEDWFTDAALESFQAGRLSIEQLTELLGGQTIPVMQSLIDTLKQDLAVALLTGADNVDELRARIEGLTAAMATLGATAQAVSAIEFTGPEASGGGGGGGADSGTPSTFLPLNPYAAAGASPGVRKGMIDRHFTNNQWSGRAPQQWILSPNDIVQNGWAAEDDHAKIFAEQWLGGRWTPWVGAGVLHGADGRTYMGLNQEGQGRRSMMPASDELSYFLREFYGGVYGGGVGNFMGNRAGGRSTNVDLTLNMDTQQVAKKTLTHNYQGQKLVMNMVG
jgi:TP901 family phage tail tape measure protein